MPAFELKSWFECGEATWTERAYWVGASFSGAMEAHQNVITARLPLLGFPARCTGLRVSQIGAWRTSYAAAPPQFLPTLPACEPWTGLRVRLQGLAGQPSKSFFRQEFLRCVPKAWLPVNGSPGLVPGPAATTAWNAWVAALAVNSICIRAEAGTGPLYRVTGLAWWAALSEDCLSNPLDPEMSVYGSTYVSLSIASPSGDGNSLPSIPAGSVVGIHGMAFEGPEGRRAPELNGSRPVEASQPGIVTVVAQPPSEGQWLASGTVQVESTLYVPVQQAFASGAGEKKVGSTKYPLLVGSFPRGYVPAVPEPILAPPAAPQPDPPFDPLPPPFPGTTLVRTAMDLAAVIHNDSINYGKPKAATISIYGVANSGSPLYYVFCSGTDSFINPVTGIPADITNGIGLPFNYPQFLADAIDVAIPDKPESVVVYCGHSLGGMAIQNYDSLWFKNQRRKLRIITFGSPVVMQPETILKLASSRETEVALQLPRYRRFATRFDLVQHAGSYALLLGLIGHPEQILVSNVPFPNNPVQAHINYWQLPSLEDFDVFGNDALEGGEAHYTNLYLALRYVTDVFPLGI